MHCFVLNGNFEAEVSYEPFTNIHWHHITISCKAVCHPKSFKDPEIQTQVCHFKQFWTQKNGHGCVFVFLLVGWGNSGKKLGTSDDITTCFVLEGFFRGKKICVFFYQRCINSVKKIPHGQKTNGDRWYKKDTGLYLMGIHMFYIAPFAFLISFPRLLDGKTCCGFFCCRYVFNHMKIEIFHGECSTSLGSLLEKILRPRLSRQKSLEAMTATQLTVDGPSRGGKEKRLSGWSVGRWDEIPPFSTPGNGLPQKKLWAFTSRRKRGLEFFSGLFFVFSPKSGVPNSWSGIVYYGSAFPGHVIHFCWKPFSSSQQNDWCETTLTIHVDLFVSCLKEITCFADPSHLDILVVL